MLAHTDIDLTVTLENFRPFLFKKIVGTDSIFSFHDEAEYSYTDIPNKTLINKDNKIEFFGQVFDVIEYDLSEERYIGYSKDKEVFVIISNDNELPFLSSPFKDIASYSNTVLFYATQYKNLIEVMENIEKVYKVKCQMESRYYIALTHNLIGTTQIIREKLPVEDIELNYASETMEEIDTILETLRSNNGASGRMAILSGQPGTGKTMCLKAISTYAYESGYTIMNINTPNVFKEKDILDRENKTLYIFDDVSWLSSGKISDEARAFFLDKFSDQYGSNDFYIFSTNEALSTLDSALIRPGRCFQSIVFPKLGKENYKQVVKSIANKNKINDKKCYTELNKYDSLTLAEIYQLVLTGTINTIDTSIEKKPVLKTVKGLG